jgi:hypothetical protein
MSSKLLKVIFAVVMSVGLIGQANASLIYFQEGTNYSDANGNLWEYIGHFDLKSNDAKDNKALNGLEAAMELFSVVGDKIEDFALSAFWEDMITGGVITVVEINEEKRLDVLDGIFYADVNHKAWYDTFDGQPGLNIHLEDIVANVDKDAGKSYDAGDFSAFVSDRAVLGFNINYVFKRVAEVPAPSTLAIFSLALCALVARQIKR